MDNPIPNQPHRPHIPLVIERALGKVRRFSNPPGEPWETVWRGNYPALHDRGDEILAVETKSGRTVADDAFARLRTFIVFGGEGGQRRSAGRAVPWSEIDRERFWE